MSAELYYFSATGNSLVAARDIAERINGKLIPIPAVVDNETIRTDADVLGIIFPAYYTHMPRIVERFVSKLTGIESKYIFAVVTVGGIAGGILDQLSEKLSLNNGSLDAGFIVRMPANYIHDSGALPVFLQNRMFRQWQDKADEIAEYILSGKSGRLEKFNPIMTFLFSKNLEKRYRRGALSPDIDRNFHVDDTCAGCGTCEKICPVHNIKLIDSRPVWQNHCEKCLACIQWCPKEAIQYREETRKRKRYHHPEVNLADMANQVTRPNTNG
ncbi:MAG: EFR1 family ferrodoxin [Dehalococcoidales bacterium]|nr:EFR1 family ferrodoxin [Dehalococcoidales bacterium]